MSRALRTPVRVLLAVLLALSVIQPGRALAYDVVGDIGKEWRAVSRAKIGEPLMSEDCGIRDHGCFQHFQRGSIYWTARTGAHHVTGLIRERWREMGWERSRVGYPTTGEECWIRDGGCFNHFEAGSIYWQRYTGAHEVLGAIRDRWAAIGWENSPVGYPTTGENCGLRSGGCFNHFQTGSIYWTAGTGAWPVFGAIRDHWAGQGWENSRFGYPVTGEACRVEGGVRICDQRFQGGTITWRSDRGIVTSRVDCAVAKCVALTFDDGPSAHTNRLLDTLGRENVKATFFVVGTMVDSNNAAVRRASDMGMEIGNHTMNHPTLTGLSYAGVRGQLDPVNDRINRITGRRATWMRPPGGATNGTVQQASADAGMGVALWNVDPYDWRDRDANVVRDRVLRDTRPGSIVLMHDLHGTTVDAVPSIIAGLKSQGYTMVTLSELVGPAQPGRVYRSR